MPLDHLVHLVPDLPEAIDAFSLRLGIAPARGGRHESIGTWNAILALEAGCYVELMAADPENPDPPLPRPFGLAALASPGLATWAVGTQELTRAVEAARERGFDPGEIVDLARETPDGERLTWRLSMGRDLPGRGLIPFLIEWGSTPHPSRSTHAVCALKAFWCTHPEPEELRALLAALGTSLRVEQSTRAGLHATLVGPAGELTLGPATFGQG